MNVVMRYARFAFYVLALPLVATAAVSAHQYLLDNTPIVTESAALDVAAISELTETYRRHTLTVDDSGVVTGRVTSANPDGTLTGLADMRVHFVQNGNVVKLVYTNRMGQFEVSGLGDGVYSFFATGVGGFAAFGIKVVHGTEISNHMDVAVVNPTFVNSKHIFDKKGLVPTAVSGLAPTPGTPSVPATASLPASPVPSEQTQTAAAAPTPNRIDGSNQIALAGGRLVGNLYNLVTGVVSPGTKAYLVQNTEAVGVAEADEMGRFAFDGVVPGIYEFVAFGPDGVAAISFEAIDGGAVPAPAPQPVPGESVLETGAPRGPSRWAGMVFPEPNYGTAVAAPQLDIPLTVASDSVIIIIQINQPVIVESYSDVPMGYASGGYYGGGGGGFGGALMDLGRFAILGWILSELFDEIDFDDDDNNPPQSPNN